jgi:hypothetical protein
MRGPAEALGAAARARPMASMVFTVTNATPQERQRHEVVGQQHGPRLAAAEEVRETPGEGSSAERVRARGTLPPAVALEAPHGAD